MEDFVKRMIEEHAQLNTRIIKLEQYLNKNKNLNTDDKVEFANKLVQLSHMKGYLKALTARLENQGVLFQDNEYKQTVARIVDDENCNVDEDIDSTDNAEK